MNNKLRLKEVIEEYTEITGNKMNINLLSKEIKSHLSQVTVWNYLQRSTTGDKELPMHIVLEISRILGFSIDYIYGKNDDCGSMKKKMDKIAESIDNLKELKDNLIK